MRYRPSRDHHDQPQSDAAQHLNGPHRVKERFLVTARILNDVIFQPDMGKEIQAHNDCRQQGHEPEEFRDEEPCQDNAAGKSQSQPQSVGGDNKIGALKGAGLKRSKTRFVAILRANPVNLGIDHHLWPSSLAFTETVYPRPIAMGGAFLFPN